jgi:dynein heavy chain
MLSNKYSTVTGDVLISAGFISLLGGFNQNYRSKIIRKWQKILTEEGFPCSKEFSFSELFGDAFKIRKWHMNLLPEDILSINNALIIEKTKSFILLIDP